MNFLVRVMVCIVFSFGCLLVFSEMSFAKQKGVDSIVSLPSPIVEYDTIDQARETLDYEIYYPHYFKTEHISSISIINQELFQIQYEDKDQKLVFRSSRIADISGVYKDYDITRRFKINGMDILARSDSCEEVSLITWRDKEIYYSIFAVSPISIGKVKEIINSVY